MTQNGYVSLNRRRLPLLDRVFRATPWQKALSSVSTRLVAMALLGAALSGTPSWAQQAPTPAKEDDPERFRGIITQVDDTSMILEQGDGSTVSFVLTENLTVFGLTPASFTDVDFGTYVGSVSVRLDEYSPIVRDSLSWLHHGFELRIIDEQLRGIALGHTVWDLTPDSVMSHGWVDDLEVRVLSIKYGPTEEEETDVDIPRDAPVFKMALADRSKLQQGAHAFVGAKANQDGDYVAVFVFVGENGATPAL